MKKLFLASYFFLILLNPSYSFANPVKEAFENAMMAHQAGDLDKAVFFHDQALKMYPNFAPSYFYLSVLYREKGEASEKIIDALKRAIEIDPQYGEAYDHLGKIYYGIGEFELAEEMSLKALEFDPDNISTLMSLAWIYLLGKSEPRNAIEYFRMALDRQKNARSYFGLGIAYFMDDQKFQALEAITELRRMDEEKMAMQLEDMLQSGRYIPPEIDGAPLIAPRKINQQPAKPVEFPSLTQGSGSNDVPVRLGTREVNPPAQPTLTGAERIRQLQQRSSPYGSSY